MVLLHRNDWHVEKGSTYVVQQPRIASQCRILNTVLLLLVPSNLPNDITYV